MYIAPISSSLLALDFGFFFSQICVCVCGVSFAFPFLPACKHSGLHHCYLSTHACFFFFEIVFRRIIAVAPSLAEVFSLLSVFLCCQHDCIFSRFGPSLAAPLSVSKASQGLVPPGPY